MINLIYRQTSSYKCFYNVFGAIKEQLELQGKLNYAFNAAGDEEINWEELVKYPVLFTRGYQNIMQSYVTKLWGKTPLFDTNTECLKRPDGGDNKESGLMRQQKNKFVKIFHIAPDDSKEYKERGHHIPVWVDTKTYRECGEPTLDGIGHMGGMRGREDFFSNDTRGLVSLYNTKEVSSGKENDIEAAKSISSYRFSIAPPPSTIRLWTARPLEIMACSRVCFMFVEPWMDIPFIDGEHLVYVRSWEELYDKYDYYKTSPEECKRIGRAGRKYVEDNMDISIAVKEMVEVMLSR